MDNLGTQNFGQAKLFPDNSTLNSRFTSPYGTKNLESNQPNNIQGQGFGSQRSDLAQFEHNKFMSSGLNAPQEDKNQRFQNYQYTNYNRNSAILTSDQKLPIPPYQQGLNQSINSKVYLSHNMQSMNHEFIRQNKEYQQNMYKNLANHLSVTEENDIPQFVLFLLREENDNIANFRQRLERDKEKVVNQLDHMRRQISNLIDDLQTHLHQQIDQHYLLFIEKYKIFKQEIIAYKSISNDLIEAQLKHAQSPNMVAKQLFQPKQYLGKNNTQIIRELDEIQQRNEFAKVQSYIHQCQSTYIRGLTEVSSHLMQTLSSPQPFYNTTKGEDTMENIKNAFARNVSQSFSEIKQFIKPLDEEQTQQSQVEQKLIYSKYV